MRKDESAPDSDVDHRKSAANKGVGRGKRRGRSEKGSSRLPRIAKQLSGELGRRLERRRSDKSKKKGGSSDGTCSSDAAPTVLDENKQSKTFESDEKNEAGTVELDGKKYVVRTGIRRRTTKVVPDTGAASAKKAPIRSNERKSPRSKQMDLSKEETAAAAAKLDSLRNDLKTLLASRANYPIDAATVMSAGQSIASDMTPLMQNGSHPRRYRPRPIRHKPVERNRKAPMETEQPNISCASVCVDVLVDSLRPRPTQRTLRR